MTTRSVQYSGITYIVWGLWTPLLLILLGFALLVLIIVYINALFIVIYLEHIVKTY